ERLGRSTDGGVHAAGKRDLGLNAPAKITDERRQVASLHVAEHRLPPACAFMGDAVPATAVKNIGETFERHANTRSVLHHQRAESVGSTSNRWCKNSDDVEDT